MNRMEAKYHYAGFVGATTKRCDTIFKNCPVDESAIVTILTSPDRNPCNNLLPILNEPLATDTDGKISSINLQTTEENASSSRVRFVPSPKLIFKPRTTSNSKNKLLSQ